MKITIQKNTRVEHNISPPMAKAITLPLLLDGRDRGVAVYVMVTPFAKPLPDADVVTIAGEVADRIHLPQNTPEIVALMNAAIAAADHIDSQPGGYQAFSDELRHCVHEVGNA